MLDEALRTRVGQTRFYLGLRDVLGAPEVIRQAWAELEAYDYLEHYDSLMIYGCRDLFPV